MGQTAIAMTDHGNVSGSYRFYKACKKEEVKPIIGMEAYYSVEDRTVKEKDDMGNSYYHLILLAQNNTGLHNLFKLSTFAFTEGMFRKPRIDDDLLGQYAEGVIATSACMGGRCAQLLLANQTREAEKLLQHHARLFQDRFFVELQLHEDDDHNKVTPLLVNLARKLDLPMVLTCDSHYSHPEDKDLHEIALCMQTNSSLSDEKRFSFGDIDVHLANHDWVAKKAERLGIPYEAISNTVSVSSMVTEDYFCDIKNRYPKFPYLPDGYKPWEALENLAKNSLSEIFKGMPPKEYQDRMNEELLVIKKMGFYDYFLILWDIMQGAKETNTWVGPGRGSAAGSLVAYSLGITKVDPIKYGLLFSRFLNSGRSSTPLIFDAELKKKLEAPQSF